MATKEAYRQKLEAQLKEWDAKLAQLSAKAQKATAEARIKYENELESLKGRQVAAHRAFAELGKRSENAWEDMKDGVEKIWDEMNKAIERERRPVSNEQVICTAVRLRPPWKPKSRPRDGLNRSNPA